MDKELHQAKMIVARRILLAILLLVVIVVGVVVGGAYVQRYNAAMEQTAVTPIREMVINAVSGLKADAPVDPRTGDIYFPQAKLYLPATSSYVQLTYAYDQSADGGLSIGNKATLERSIAALYGAQDIRQMFERLPYAQACQRGVTVAYEKLSAPDKKQQAAVKLNNGKTAYLYTEPACSELGETVELLKNLRAY